jgi:hypothetical protein
MPSTPSTSTLLRSTLLRGAAIAVALTLPGLVSAVRKTRLERPVGTGFYLDGFHQ